MARARDARGRRPTFAKATLETTRRATARRSRCSCGGPTKCAADPCPVDRRLPRRPRGPGARRVLGGRAALRRRGLRLRRAERARLDGYGKTWLHADDGAEAARRHHRHRGLRRSTSATSWAKDGKAPKVGVIGGSYGGYSTLMAMTYFAGAYDAGVARRRHLEPDDVPHEHRAVPPHPAHLGVRRSGEGRGGARASCRRSRTSTKVKAPLLLDPGRQRSARAGRRGGADLPRARARARFPAG